MALLKLKARQGAAVSRVSEGEDVYLRALKDGTMVKADWIQACIIEGRGFMVNHGSFSLPIVGGGDGTAIAKDEPEVVIGIPKGTSMMPIRVDVVSQLSLGLADDNEIDILLCVDQDKDNGPSSGTNDAVSIYNLNTLHPREASCWARVTYDAAMTTPVLDLELAHVCAVYETYTSIAGEWQEFNMHYEPKAPPIINGPAMLILYFGGTIAQHCFSTIQWIEFPSSLLTD